MLTYIFDFVKQLLGYNNDEHYSETEENYLAEELINLEIAHNESEDYSEAILADPPSQEVCFERTGKITHITETYLLIDGNLYFEFDLLGQRYNVGESVDFVAYRDKDNAGKVLRILQNRGLVWGDEQEEEKHFDIIEHVIVGEVGTRDGRMVFIKDTGLKYSLDEVETNLIPMPGDWLELCCTVQWDNNAAREITADNVIKVLSVKALRSILRSVKVTYFTPEYGICDSQIYFNKESISYGCIPELNSKVIVEAIESNQGSCTWRALHVVPDTDVTKIENTNKVTTENRESSLKLEKDKNISVTDQIYFDNINLDETKAKVINVANNSTKIYTIKWKILSKRSDSQITVKPVLHSAVKLHPNQSINFEITCKPKFLGYSKELFVLVFNGFEIKRSIEINVNDRRLSSINNAQVNDAIKTNRHHMNDAMKKVLNNKSIFIPGVKAIKSAAFVPVRLGRFPVPDKLWNILLTNSNRNIDNISGYDTLSSKITRIESALPCLASILNIHNYTDRWHTLLYMEEVQVTTNMRAYDLPKIFLGRCQEYLTVEVAGLAEKRPSLIIGDKVIAKDIWDSSKPDYQGFIHAIRGNTLMIKFNSQFHDTYTGYDLSLHFFNNSALYRRCHQSINLAISHLGPAILFPKSISIQSPQVSEKLLQSITWYNKGINECQKSAVGNIIKGVCRPLPYCVFGPPGTGKTITLVETVLQILSLLPYSRVLVATPSNSAANLFTERFINTKSNFTGSVIRLIAHHLLDSDGIPDNIKPYCATMDIAQEGTAELKHEIRNKINVQCRTSFIGRHRVTIGTCSCIGTLAQMGLPKGHFTHIVIDEAGQASEPEIMIPLTFIDKEKGQIILAGDPMQLGPIIISKYCIEFGMNESYLNRILETFPYQKDPFTHRFDERFVTQLVDNYRSLENVLCLPSAMFYDGTLIPRKKHTPLVMKLLDDVSGIFPNNSRDGGIYMYGIQGQNYRAEDSPSWFNPQEALMVLMTTCKLYKKNVTPDQIGIISPYIAQIRYLRKLFESTGAELPKIATVEEFQGQERPIILISTVRSSVTISQVEEDLQFSLGFIRHPNRLNVAITRGEVAVLIFCNPHLLCLDQLWNKVITHVVNNNCYTGCDLPEKFCVQ